LREGLENALELPEPLPRTEVARLTAVRAAQADPRANLLPLEFQTRYQQQFVDRLWMRGIGAIVAIYLVGIAIYFVALGVVGFQTRSVEKQVADLGLTYTNALQIRDRFQVLKERQELKFAALDCWNTTAERLPEAATLETLTFSQGRRLTLSGTAPNDEVQSLIEFEGQMRKATDANGQLLFDSTKGDNLSYRANPGNSSVTWNLTLELKRVEVQ
jgi:hypothetical protein